MNWSRATTLISHNASSGADESWQQSVQKNHTSSASSRSTLILSEVNLALWQTVPPLLLLSGCFGNVMTIVVMRGMRDSSSSAASLYVFFTALALSDLFILSSSLLWYWPKLMFPVPFDYFQDLSCTLLFFVFYTSSLTSAWFLVAMTCQRVTSVVLPHRVGVLCTVRRAKVIVAVVVVIACAANVQIFYNYRMEYVDEEYKRCESVDETLAHVFLIVDLTLASVIPFVILMVGNSVLISRAMRSVRFSQQMMMRGRRGGKDEPHQTSTPPPPSTTRVTSMTSALVLTSVAFLLLTLPTCVLDVYLEAVGYCERQIEDEELDAELTLADSVCVLLWMSNSAINFYLYILSGSKFRQESKRCLSSCLCFRDRRRRASVKASLGKQ